MSLVQTCQHAVNEMNDFFYCESDFNDQVLTVLSDLLVLVAPSVVDVEHVHRPQPGTKLHGIGQSNWPSLNQNRNIQVNHICININSSKGRHKKMFFAEKIII